jgi:hypothetical protein
MDIKTDFKSLVEEVKERNRLFLALNQIREIALDSFSKDMPIIYKSQFQLILQKCDDTLKESN